MSLDLVMTRVHVTVEGQMMMSVSNSDDGVPLSQSNDDVPLTKPDDDQQVR